jgi:hypothetical protein
MPYTYAGKHAMLNALAALATHVGLFQEGAAITAVTGVAATDLLTKAGSGLANGDLVVLRSLTGGAGSRTRSPTTSSAYQVTTSSSPRYRAEQRLTSRPRSPAFRWSSSRRSRVARRPTRANRLRGRPQRLASSMTRRTAQCSMCRPPRQSTTSATSARSRTARSTASIR